MLLRTRYRTIAKLFRCIINILHYKSYFSVLNYRLIIHYVRLLIESVGISENSLSPNLNLRLLTLFALYAVHSSHKVLFALTSSKIADIKII